MLRRFLHKHRQEIGLLVVIFGVFSLMAACGTIESAVAAGEELTAEHWIGFGVHVGITFEIMFTACLLGRLWEAEDSPDDG